MAGFSFLINFRDMKSSIKLKYGAELEAVIKNPIHLSILVQIAFKMDEETGEALLFLPKEWNKEADELVILGLIEHNEYNLFKIKNKKVVDITLKKKPSKGQIDKQPLNDATIVPPELVEYHEITKAFWDLFYANLKSINGRLYNLERAKFGAWVTPIRLMITEDKITREQLRAVFKFLQKSDFWRDKVQSTEKLRAKFNTLFNQLKSDEQRDSKAGGGSVKGGKNKVSTDYVKRVFNDLQS